jgi:hypothetical protein
VIIAVLAVKNQFTGFVLRRTYQTSNNPTVPSTQDAITDGVFASLGSPLSTKSSTKKVQFLLMSDKMRYGN